MRESIGKSQKPFIINFFTEFIASIFYEKTNKNNLDDHFEVKNMTQNLWFWIRDKISVNTLQLKIRTFNI